MTSARSSVPDRVSYVEAHNRFVALDNGATTATDANPTAFQVRLAQSLQYMKKCLEQRQQDSVLSANERFFELHNAQLYALCLEYYLGTLVPQQVMLQQHSVAQQKPATDHARTVATRLALLSEADAFLTEFLDRAERCGLLSAAKRREQYERLEAKRFARPREEKIQLFQLQREMTLKLQQVQKRRAERQRTGLGEQKQTEAAEEDGEEEEEAAAEDDELEREQLLTFLELAVVKCLDEQTAVNQEKDMLETMVRMNAATDTQDLFSDVHRPTAPLQGQGIEVTRINPQMEMQRETIRSGVFQPGHRLPTMSLAEYADREVADATERQKNAQEAPQGPRRYEQLVEDGDEDDEALVEEAVYKDRAWDDWKDANEKGIGNKKGSQF
ncbi:unnamed protein product [Hyaloperonospora brassicae]|uniref:TAP42-like protein n=1 Tax=Hyaloperonospora brassicae TaxID=162125 RepID=A0AAV0TF26_HYABA|nr:unnamed protein product [Hyaloperonospora brassicae]